MLEHFIALEHFIILSMANFPLPYKCNPSLLNTPERQRFAEILFRLLLPFSVTAISLSDFFKGKLICVSVK